MVHEFRADLHCHSICSDGSDTPLELLHRAKSIRLSGLSITDHDTIAAYTPELFAAAKSASIRILPGVEISSEFERVAVHILGYGCDFNDTSFGIFLQEIRMRRICRNRAILEKLAARGMRIQEEELSNIQTVGRPHIASILVKKGYVLSLKDAFDRYLKDDAPCYVFGFKYTPYEVIERIQASGGKAVLAHPHFYKNGAWLKKILSLPLDGIECYYALLHEELEVPWVKLAAGKRWIATGGSDYHGSFKPHIPLGASWVNETTFHALSKIDS